MGNIPSADLSKVDLEVDKEIIGLQTSALFNDGFVSALVEKFPSYGYVDPQQSTATESSSRVEIGEAKTNENEQRMEKFMTIFSSDLGGCSKVEDFPILSVDKTLASSGFSMMSNRRARLLVRLYQAYRNQLTELKSTGNKNSKNSSGLYWQLPIDDDNGNSASQQEVLSNLSINMSLTLARAFGTQNPAVVRAILQTLLDGLVIYQPLSLRNTPGLEHTLNSIRSFATETLVSSADVEIKGLAISLLLTMGLLVGSVMTIVQTVDMLSQYDIVLHDKVLQMVEQCIDISADFDISFPNAKVSHDKFPYAVEIPEDKKKLRTVPQLMSIASDGTFFYVFEGFTCTLSKIGSGMNGSLPGELIGVSKPLPSLISELKAEKEEPSAPKESSPIPVAEFQPLTFSPTKKSDLIALSNGNRTARCRSEESDHYCSVLIDQAFPAHSGGDRIGKSYFEITIESDAMMAIGFASARFSVDGSEMLGWEDGTFAYHSDGEFHGSNEISDDEGEDDDDLPSWDAGDIVGCGIDYQQLKLFFTFNGRVVGRPFSLTDSSITDIFPVVCIEGSGSVTVNTGQAPFRYGGPLVLGPMMGDATIATATPHNDQTLLVASLSVHDNSLFVHFNKGLDSRRVAVFNTVDLEYRGELDLFPVAEEQSKKDNEALYTFEFDASQELFNIRSTKGFAIEVVEATAGDVDVQNTINSLRNASGNSLFSKNLKDLLKSTFPLKITCKCVPQEANRLCLPIACADTFLYAIEETNGSKTTAKRVFDALSELRFVSAAVETVSNGEIDVSSIAQGQWFIFLEKFHNDDKDSYSSLFQADFKDILSSISTEENNERDESEAVDMSATANKLNISFIMGDDQKSSINFTDSCQWNVLIEELEDALDHREPSFNVLKIKIDPVPQTVASFPLICRGYDPLKAADLTNASLLCNGHQLMIISPAQVSGAVNEVRARAWKFSLDKKGEVQRFFNKKFSNKSCGTPTSFCFDVANNMIIGFDSSTSSVLKWRNSGFSPSSVPRVEFDENNEFGTAPSHRIELLWQQFQATKASNLQGPVLLSLLDKLSEPYGNNLFSLDNANSDALNQVKLTAKWTSDQNRCIITIRDSVVEFDDNEDNSEDHIGYHIVVLNKHTFAVEKTRWFITKSNVSNKGENLIASNRMGDFLNDLEEGSVILVANAGNVHENMGRYCVDALMNFGACDLETERGESMVMIGVKGLKPGTADYFFGQSGEVVKLVRYLPPRTIPLKLEPTPNALFAILRLCESFVNALQSQETQTTAIQRLSLSSSLRILQVNLHNFSNRTQPEEALKNFGGERILELKSFLQRLMGSSLIEIAEIRDAGVGLFVASLGFVFPKSNDQVALLHTFAKKYQDQSISQAELSILQVLLRKFLKGSALFTVSKQGKLEFDSVFRLIEVVQLIIHQETRVLLENALIKRCTATESPIYSAAVQLFASLTRTVVAFATEPLISGNQSLASSSSDIGRIFSVVSIVSKISSNFFVNILQFLKDNSEATIDTTVLLDMLQRSPVGSILPFTTMAVSELVRSWGYKFISVSMESVLAAIHELDDCLAQMSSVLSLLSPEANQYSDAVPQKQSSTRVFESEHPYRSNMDERTVISFPGATSVTITFDSKTRTEHSCDYVIFQDSSGTCLHPQVDKFSGRDGNENWAGCGGRPPLTLNVSDFVCYFHSDGSVEDWGYKFTATASYPLKLTTTNRLNWLAKLSFEIVQALSLIGAGMLEGTPWNEEIESSSASWMENSLVKPEYFHAEREPTDVEAFLFGLIDRKTNATADKFLRKIRLHVPEDQGSDEVVNRAVYATCAAIIRGNNLTAEAIAFASGNRSDLSTALIKAWKAGQKMRSYFVLSDMKDSMGMQPFQAGKTKLQQSIYAGAPEEVIAAASEAVVTRAKFLLRSTSASDTSTMPSIETTSATDTSLGVLSPLGGVLSSMVGSNDSSPLRSAGNSPVNKWSLATKAIKLQRQVSHESKNVQAMWHSLVDEAVVLDKLKNVFLQRRKFAEKSKMGKELTTTEKILNFVQSEVDINKLHEANAIRNKRAIVRSKGFDVFAHLLHEKASPFAVFITTATYVTALMKFRRAGGAESENLHFSHSLEGCSTEQNNLLWQKFCSFLTRCVSTVLRAHAQYSTSQDKLWEKALVNTLRACAMDYDITDHQTIFESQITGALEQILRSNNSILIKQTAGALLETIVSRFIVFDNTNEAGEATELNKALISILANLLPQSRENAAGSDSANASSAADHALIDIPTPLFSVDEVVDLRSLAGGKSIPHCDLPLDHTLTFSIGREAGSLDELSAANLTTGAFVTRSIYWEDDKSRPDGGMGNVGVIKNVLENGKKAVVKWNRGKEYVYKIGIDNADAEAKPEVVLADPSIAGFLFSKGFSDVANDNELKKTTPFITMMTGQMVPDGTLLITYVFADARVVRIRSKERLPSSKWVHLAISTDLRSKLTVFVDGNAMNSAQFNELNFCGSATLSVPKFDESVALPAIDLAAKFVVWVESVSSFNDDTMLIVQSDDGASSMIPIHGDKDLPGILSAALCIPSSQANISVVGVDSNTELNLKAAVRGISSADTKSLQSSTTKLPWYFGQPPSFSSIASPNSPVGVNVLLREFSVYGSALPSSAIRSLASLASCRAAFEEENARKPNEISVLNVLGILRRSLGNLDNLADSPMRRCFANCGIVAMLFEQFSSKVANVRVAAFQLAAHIFPAMDVELIDASGWRAQLYSIDKSFVDYLCEVIGDCFNIWKTRAQFATNSSAVNMQSIDMDIHAIAFAQLHLLRSFASGLPCWQERFCEAVKSLVDFALRKLPDLKAMAESSFAREKSSGLWDIDHLGSADRIFALLSIIGGNPLRKFGPGSRVTYCDESSGMAEQATVLGPAAIPEIDLLNKDIVKKWNFAKSFGDAVAVLLDSDPKTPLIVPVHTLSSKVEDTMIPAKVFDALREHVGVENLIKLFQELISVSVADPRPSHGLKEVVSEEERTYESAHPYPDNEDHFENIVFEGAEKIEIVFDEQSRTEDGCDYVLFCTDNSRKRWYGEKYMGRHGNENFAGCGGRAPLTIPASSALLHFHSDSSGNDWGYKFTAKAKCRKQTYPPEHAPVPNHYMTSTLKMLGMKALMLMASCDWVVESMVCLLPQVLQSALLPLPSTTVLSAKGGALEELMFESSHPYADSMDSYTPVHVPGATRFIITFDADTRTENNCDYLIFYTDDSHNEKVPDSETYTGGKDGSSSNWPGLNGKAPLVIEGDSFVFYFHSDSSVNDWGYRMFVTVEKAAALGAKTPIARGAGMTALEAETCSCILQGLLMDGMGVVENNYESIVSFPVVSVRSSTSIFSSCVEKSTRFLRAMDEEEESKEEDVLAESKTDDDDHIPPRDASSSLSPTALLAVSRVNPPRAKKYATLSVSDVTLYSNSDKSSAVVETLSNGQKIIIVDELSLTEWVQVQKVESFDDNAVSSSVPTGWILRRSPSNGEMVYQFQDFGLEIIAELPDEQLNPKKKNAKQSAEKKDSEYRNPMYGVSSTAADLKGEKNASAKIRASDIVVQDYQFVDQAIADYNAIAAIFYAHQGVTKILEHWPSKFTLSAEKYFGSMENLLSYLSLCLDAVDIKELSSSSAALTTNSRARNDKSVGAKRLLGVVIQDAAQCKDSTDVQHTPGVLLLRCAQQLLDTATAQPAQKTFKPVKRGIQHSIESSHPYEHNLNQDFPLSFPGAKKLELCFAENSATETNYDHITIYTDASKSTRAYAEKIHGYTHATQKHWPGVNVAPVIIDGSSCVVNFTTDSGTNDWGWKLNIFAVYEEPSEAEISSYVSQSDVASHTPTKLAVSVFHYFATQLVALSPLLRQVLFTTENFRTLIKFFNSAESSVFRAELLDIFVVFISIFSSDEAFGVKIFEELLELETSLLSFANEKYAVETNSGARMPGVTLELQSTVQMIITLQAAIRAIRVRLPAGALESKDRLELRTLCSSSAAPAASPRVLFHPESTNSKSIITWQITLKKLATDNLPYIGLISDVQGASRGAGHVGVSTSSTEMSLHGSSMLVNGKRVKLAACKSWSAGDVLTMQLDRLNGLLHFTLNGVALPLMVGPPTKAPVFEMNIVGINCFFAVSLADAQDEVDVRLMRDNAAVTTTMSETSKHADHGKKSGRDWLQSVRDVQSILHSIATRQIPECIVNSKLLPFCNKKLTLHWRLSADELLDGSETQREMAFPSASQISFVVEESSLDATDRVEFLDKAGRVLTSLSGDAFAVSNVQQLTPFIAKLTARSVDAALSRASSSSCEAKSALAAAGDLVMRGPAWQHGGEDGGLGAVGTVVKCLGQGARPADVVLVRWSNGFEGSYSNVAERQSVVVLDRSKISDDKNNNTAFHRATDGTFVFSGDFVKLRICCGSRAASSPSLAEGESSSSKTTTARSLSLHVVPCLSTAACLHDAKFAAFREHLSSLYVVKNRAALSSLVRHVNKMAREKSISREELLAKKWAEIAPSPQDLTRSAALQDLFELDALAWSEEDLAVVSSNLVFTPSPSAAAAANADEEDGQEDEEEPQGEITLSDEIRGCYLSEYASWGGIHEFESLEFALMAARQVHPVCQGITQEGRNAFTLRAGNVPLPSPSGENSWLLIAPPKREKKKKKSVAPKNVAESAAPALSPASPALGEGEGEGESGVSAGCEASLDVDAIRLEEETQREVEEEEEPDASAHSEEEEENSEEEEEEEESGNGDEDEDHDDDEDDDNSDSESDSDSECDSDRGSECDREFEHFVRRGRSRSIPSESDSEDEHDAWENGSVPPPWLGSRSADSNSSNSMPLMSLFEVPERVRSEGNAVPVNAASAPAPAPLPCCHKCHKAVRLHPAGTWGLGWSCDWPGHEGPNSFTSQEGVYGCETIMSCNWGICRKCWDKIVPKAAADDGVAERLRQTTLSADTRPIEALFGLLQLLNHSLIEALSLIDLSRKDKLPGTLAFLVSANRDLIFECVKKPPFEEAVTATTGSGGQFELFLSRFRARKNAAAGKVDTDGRWSVFSQAFRVMHSMNPATLRRADKLYNTKFMGEHAQDAGGPYRESFDNYAEELQSNVLPLFIRTPNGRHAVGYNREKWILNPNATTSVQFEMLSFVGKLMGIAIRSKEYMSFNIPSIIWKLIAGDSPAKEDLEAVDYSLFNSLDMLRNIDKTGVDEVTFSTTFFETFTTTSSDDRVVELVPGGKDIDVTFANRQQYCDLVLQYRLHEFDHQAAAIREGLSTIIPISLLSMYRWDELEEIVCGKPDIDVKLLETVAEYSSCSASDAHIRMFWQAMEEFTNEERSAFIKFTWGRSRLPLNAAGFTQRFKLQSFDKNPPDNYLPVAHTCFFSIELPRYSSLEVMKEKLRYAIFNCQAIDGDETSSGMTVAAMGWEEEEEE